LNVERYKLARPALEQAVRAWRQVVRELEVLELDVGSKNGASPEDSA
jgi:hypothetical protein